MPSLALPPVLLRLFGPAALSDVATTNATATDATPANDDEAPSKDRSEEYAANATAVADGLVKFLAAAVDGG